MKLKLKKNKTNKYPIILIIDSDIGGIYVYKEIKKILSYVKYIYLLDNYGFPYGEKSSIFIFNRIEKIIIIFYKKYKIDIILLACNTASTTCLSLLKKKFPNIFIFGIEPDIKLAINKSKNNFIGILATNKTINNISKKINNKLYKNKYKLLLIGSSELVIIAKNKFQKNNIYLNDIKKIVNFWLEIKKIPDTIILGCTHFLWLIKELKMIFPKETVFIKSINLIINEIKFFLENLSNNFKKNNIKKDDILYYTKNDFNLYKTLNILKKYSFSSIKNIII